MSLATNIADAFLAVATKIKESRTWINGNAADLGGLDTTAKANLVAAINEVNASVASASGIDDAQTSLSTSWSSSKTRTEIDTAVSGVEVDLTDLIDDETASTSTVYSSAQTNAVVVAAREALLGGAGPAYDTLGELQGLLEDSGDAVAALNAALGNRVRVDEEQAFSGGQRTQGRDNIGAASAASVTALATLIGDVDGTDFVAIFESGL